VQPGDTLFRIALRFGTTVEAIVLANGIVNPQLISVGQKLWIPGSSDGEVPGPTIYVVQRGDTLYSIARRFGTTWRVLAAVNGLSDPRSIHVGQQLIIPGADPGSDTPGSGTPAPTPPPSQEIYIVRPGDTLWSIAMHHGTTTWAIIAANDLQNPSLIYPGQELIIP